MRRVRVSGLLSIWTFNRTEQPNKPKQRTQVPKYPRTIAPQRWPTRRAVTRHLGREGVVAGAACEAGCGAGSGKAQYSSSAATGGWARQQAMSCSRNLLWFCVRHLCSENEKPKPKTSIPKSFVGYWFYEQPIGFWLLETEVYANLRNRTEVSVKTICPVLPGAYELFCCLVTQNDAKL